MREQTKIGWFAAEPPPSVTTRPSRCSTEHVAAEAVAYIVMRDRRVAVNEILIRSGEQTW